MAKPQKDIGKTYRHTEPFITLDCLARCLLNWYLVLTLGTVQSACISAKTLQNCDSPRQRENSTKSKIGFSKGLSVKNNNMCHTYNTQLEEETLSASFMLSHGCGKLN